MGRIPKVLNTLLRTLRTLNTLNSLDPTPYKNPLSTLERGNKSGEVQIQKNPAEAGFEKSNKIKLICCTSGSYGTCKRF